MSIITFQDVLKGGAGSGSWDGPASPRFSWSGKENKKKIQSDIQNRIQTIWDKNFPQKKVKIDVEVEKDYGDGIRITTELKPKGKDSIWDFQGDTVMMSTIYPKRKEVHHDFYFLDDDKLKKKGFSSSHIKYIEDIAKKSGVKKASLVASDEGRWTWPKLGFKCSSRKQFLEIQAKAKTKGIEIKTEMDFEKAKNLFKKELKSMDIEMSKTVGVFPTRTKKKGVAGLEEDLCPVCGWKLEVSRSGTWCVNPECEVLDDADNYKKEA